jgi:signal transduction histidine kinase/ligand-binding sensor domain-containing protein/DNA-binding response OmpR family regulator
MIFIRNKAQYILSLSIGLLLSIVLVAQSKNMPNKETYKFVNIDINDGLSNNQVTCILKDSQGFMWFGTQFGLNRYDGNQIKTFTQNVNDSSSIPFNQVRFIFEDKDKLLWVRSHQNFTIYNPFSESFSSLPAKYKNTKIPLNGLRWLYADSKDNTWFLNTNNVLYKYSHKTHTTDSILYNPLIQHSNNYPNQMAEDSEGNIWIVSYTGEVAQINPDTKETIRQFQTGDANNDLIVDYQFYIDSKDNTWIYTRGYPVGLFLFEKKTGKVKHLKHSESGEGISSNMVADVLEDENGIIWVAMDHGGINILDQNKNIVSRISSNENDKYSLAESSINCLYRDAENIIWIGTFKNGISYYHKDLIRFPHYKHSSDISKSLPYNDINCITEDSNNNIWLGTNGGGLIYFNRKNNTFKTYKHNPNDPNSLSIDVIVSIYIDRDETLWLGTYQGGLNSFDGKKFTRYVNDINDSTSISDNRIWDIYEDSKRNFWIGTFNGGLNLMNRETGKFKHYKQGDNSIGSNFVMTIIEDSENKLWMGTTNGLSVLDLNTRQFKIYPPNPGVPGELSGDHVNDVHEDSRGLIWLATNFGLNVLNKKENKFKTFTELDGLKNSNIRTLEEDMQGNLWLSSFNGISKINVKEYSSQNPISELQIEVENFGLEDGLQGNEFNQKSVLRTRSGELVYGGANGFNLFYPETISDYEPEEKIVLTSFKVFNEEVKVNVPFRDRIILKKSITYENKINLKHNENVFSFGFAALNYFHPEKNNFQYRLSGFNNQWLDVNKGFNEITFTNLDAGTYQLGIRSSRDNIRWKVMSPPLTIEILPPLWKSTYAYMLYFVILFLIIFVTMRTISERHRLKFVAEQEHREAERMQQIDALKTKFFTNISHEFRTPLSLILSPLEKIIEKTKNTDQRNHLILIQRNARRLQAMVNQLLDFRKMELHKIEVKKNWGELIGFIREIGSNFEDLVESKQITYKFSSNCEQLYTNFDKNKTDKIISNLLSNAFKFTPINGNVILEVLLEKDTNAPELTIAVSDTGIGIPINQQANIFDRFYQTGQAGTEINQGSGIGLSMVREYLNLLEGKIRVNSTVEEGSTFTVNLPVQLFSEVEIEIFNKNEQQNSTNTTYKQAKLEIEKKRIFDNSKKTIIIVEDNADFRFYLSENLKTKYNILEAENGLIGWELIAARVPDLIVSDVMMPEMDGVELCQKIKSNRNTKHIPVVLLTAKAETEPHITGYKAGADGYITKPFDFRVLESRIENLINTRKQLRLSFQSMIGLNPEKVEMNSEDEKFIKKALLVVDAKIAEPSFTVENFGREMGMSRVSLYKKLLALTDKSPIEFIRIIRLKRAANLLVSSQLSVSEVAYQVGFNNPRYFSKYFSKEYQMLPSKYIAKHRQSSVDISKEIKDKFS